VLGRLRPTDQTLLAQPTGRFGPPGRRAHDGMTRNVSSMTGLAMGLHVEHHGDTSDPPGKVVGSGAHCAELLTSGRRSLAARRCSAVEVLPSVAVDGPGGSCSFWRSMGFRLVTQRRRGMVARCGGGESCKAVVAGMILTESGEGRGWSGHRRR
jgi:hypothetical protein